ncbi:hypothetical protein QFW77_05695 [Luteimonas sp. RD2P54]|uniref:Uncharacterized protein n=1 Tax=Luteimonas endophytica TaxID=3042023 RepID=A0ABT6J6N1_9GAMM|nr:hypothetical protein [Luteimonas endophytica]MDH5822483.1 hypothetical protein [Luteimonas endophytica]
MPGNFIVKASQHPFLAGESRLVGVPSLPDTRIKLFDEGFVLKDKATGEPLPNVPYRILLKDGSYMQGVTDKLGRTFVVGTAEIETLVLEVKEH